MNQTVHVGKNGNIIITFINDFDRTIGILYFKQDGNLYLDSWIKQLNNYE